MLSGESHRQNSDVDEVMRKILRAAEIGADQPLSQAETLNDLTACDPYGIAYLIDVEIGTNDITMTKQVVSTVHGDNDYQD